MAEERAAFAGQITDLPVVELLRTISSGKKTGVARFDTNLGAATVWFREGVLVDADMGRFHMGDAIRRLLSTDAGSFEVEFKPVTRRRLIQESTASFLGGTSQARARPQAAPSESPDLEATVVRRGPVGRRPRTGASWRPTAGGTGAAPNKDNGAEGGSSSQAPPQLGGAGTGKPPAASQDVLRRLEALRRSPQAPSTPVIDRRTVNMGSASALNARGIVDELETRPTSETPQAGLEELNRTVTEPSAHHSHESLDERTVVAPARAPAQRRGAPKDRPNQRQARGQARPQPASRRPSAPPSPSSSPSPSVRGTTAGIPAAMLDDALPNAERRDARGKANAPASSSSTRSAEENGWKFLDKNDSSDDFAEDDLADRTMMRAGPLSVTKAAPRRPGGGRRPGARKAAEQASPRSIEPQEDLSEPLPIGTSWSAPAHVSTPRAAPIDSARKSSAGGEISKSRKGVPTEAQRNTRPASAPSPTPDVLASHASDPAFSPGLSKAPTPAPDATVTHGFRPLTDAEGPDGHANPNNVDVDAPMVRAPDHDSGGVSSAAQVGRYEVLLRIARGGMGTVYLCQVTGAGGFRRLFALKVIRDHLSRNEEYVRMMLQEARIASRLHHPNVVGIVDIGNLANQHYLVMDYVEGCTLSELLKVHRKTRPPQLIIPIVLDALTGLHAAHSLTEDNGSPLTLVHCDFSPQNMLLGTNGICRITDFGIARAANALPERSDVTRGKPAYLAPEQISGRPFDHRADIFAAGIVLWNALTGEQLFTGGSPQEVLDRVLHQEIPPPSTAGLRPPRRLDKVVLRALERDPDKRYQTAEQMLIDLRKVAIGGDLLAPSSDVAKWVTDTFGAQLELRRQAAGLSPGGMISSGSSPSNRAIHPGREVAEDELPTEALGAVVDPRLSSEDSATQAIVAMGQRGAIDSNASQTMMLRSDSRGAAVKESAQDSEIPGKLRKILLAGAISAGAGLLAVAVVRPELLQGGMLDEEGEYIDLSFDDPLVVDTDGLAEPPPEGKASDGKAPDSKASDGKAPDSKTSDGKAPDGQTSDGKAPDGQQPPDGDPPSPSEEESPAGPSGAAEPAKPKPKPKPRPKPKSKDTAKPKPKDEAKPAPEPELPSAPNLEELLDPKAGK